MTDTQAMWRRLLDRAERWAEEGISAEEVRRLRAPFESFIRGLEELDEAEAVMKTLAEGE